MRFFSLVRPAYDDYASACRTECFDVITPFFHSNSGRMPGWIPVRPVPLTFCPGDLQNSEERQTGSSYCHCKKVSSKFLPKLGSPDTLTRLHLRFAPGLLHQTGRSGILLTNMHLCKSRRWEKAHLPVTRPVGGTDPPERSVDNFAGQIL
jgi:hypothetical protein